MLTHFQDDKNLQLLDVKPQDIVKILTPEQIIKIMVEHGAEKYEEYETHIIFPTICHNPYGAHMSMKLYYYKDSHLFRCYTECDETMNIFKVVQKAKEINREKFIFSEVLFELIGICNTEDLLTANERYIPIITKYQKQIGFSSLPNYDKNVLSVFTKYHTPEWLKEGITRDVHDYFGIGFSISHNSISIPHFGVTGDLVGIRGRRMDFEIGGGFAKYAPLTIEGKLYAHPLSLNLYGIWENKKGITQTRKAIIFEGEKSCLKHRAMYGENSNAVACCGSSINLVQIKLLIKFFNVQEIIIALDKEYIEYPSAISTNYFNKLYGLGAKYSNYANISFIFDTNNLLEEKDAPVDKGSAVFEQLYNQRVAIV